MNDLITVIVTVYNREKYLKQCLDSLKNQTYTNFEAIIVDDGSTDSSIEIIKSFLEDKRFKLIESEHIGFSAVKNIGLDNVKGKYIIFLDSDDFVYPEWLEFLYDAILKTGADISTCLYDEFKEGKTESLPEPPHEYYQTHPYFIAEYSFLKMNLIYHYHCSCYLWNKLVRKELYEDIRFKDQPALSDISEIYKIVDKANKVVQVQTPLIHYRRHMESTGAECGRNLLSSVKFRADILEQSVKFTWEHYPQSRYVAQMMLLNEINKMIKMVGQETFYKEIDRQFFRDIFKEKPIQYVFQNLAALQTK